MSQQEKESFSGIRSAYQKWLLKNEGITYTRYQKESKEYKLATWAKYSKGAK